MKYAFRSENGSCPKHTAFGREYYIQDRYCGGDKYEYVLMSRPAEKPKAKHFKNKNEMVSNLLGTVITDEIAANLLLSQMTVYQCVSFRMLEQNGKKYVWDDTKNELRKCTEPKQETGYCDTYLECLNMAKGILEKEEQEYSELQLSLFN